MKRQEKKHSYYTMQVKKCTMFMIHYDTLKDSFNNHFLPKKNVDFETFKFRQLKQETHEIVQDFCTRLRRMAATCDFTDPDREIKAQILQGCLSQGLRRKGLRDDMNLTKLLETALALELSDKQAREMESDNPPSVNKITKHPPRRGGKPYTDQQSRPQHQQQRDTSHQRSRPQQQQQHTSQNRHNVQHQSRDQQHTSHQSSGSRPCGWCGGARHTRNVCPAKDKVCRSCSKIGHYGSVCRSSHHKVRQINTQLNDLHFDQNEQIQSESEDESLFAVHGHNTEKTPVVEARICEIPGRHRCHSEHYKHSDILYSVPQGSTL